MANVLIVESPSKAKTINKYLDSKFKVVASFGHVRDFPAKNGSVDPDNDFAMKYEIIDKSEKHIKVLEKAVNKVSEIYLATDPDREGEAIAWHVVEALKERNAINNNVKINRVVFNEVTKNAVLSSINNPRSINMDLVNAQQARRALDYLVGFTLSPVLWRKLPGSKSAGRVQSVALRLICERENEIEKFITQEYWDIKAELQNTTSEQFFAFLSHYNNKKFEKFDIKNEQEAQKLSEIIKSKSYFILNVENKKTKRNPYSPFITSTLQQEAATKLGFSAKSTMSIAQKLYEGIDIGGETVGLITYMRTDGLYIAEEAINKIRSTIPNLFGEKYLPKTARKYEKKVKNAQEAHEAIRPTDISILPNNLENYLTEEQLKLYDLIWKRTIASQMESAIIDQVLVDIESSDKVIKLHTIGSTLQFDGFYKVYQDSNTDIDNKNQKLPKLNVGDPCKLNDVLPKQHFTQPPPRYSEASLVKKMEEIGIGRPSTYASIISVLQDREYVTLGQKRFIPSERGRIVNVFLINFFSRYVEYNFTANLEEELDLISNGKINWKDVLRQFWNPFIENINSVKQLKFDEVLNKINQSIEQYFFPHDENGNINKKCLSCQTGQLNINIGRNGLFLGCSNYPECKYTKNVHSKTDDGDTADVSEFPRIIGVDNVTNQDIYLKKGPYGIYLQLGEDKKGKRASLPKSIDPASLDLDTAIKLLSLPISLGYHSETNKEIKLGFGKFGPYIFYDGKYYSIKNKNDFLNTDLNSALTIISESPNTHNSVIKSLGKNEKDEEILICKGRYGFYIKCGKENFALNKKDLDINAITLSDALSIMKQKSKNKFI